MHAKPVLIKDILYAQQQTKSHAEAARYLNISFTTYKKYAKLYKLYDNEHKNPAGKGVAKSKKRGIFGVQEILDGKHPNYDRTKLKERLIRLGYVPNSCAYCGHNKTRPDGRGPYTLDYKDGDRTNTQLNNLQLICHNCSYLTNGKIVPASVSVPYTDHDYYEQISPDEMEQFRDELFNS